jgi:hypothetical protein
MSDLLNSASLVMIPSGYKEDTVFSAIPTDGSGDLSFTRASNGTRINSAGLVEVTPWNIVQQSETFDNAIWNLYYGTITSNSQTAPNGTLTADTLTSSTQQYSGIYQSLGTLPTNVYTYSIYAKAGTNNFFGMLGQGTGSQIAIFNLSTGVVSSISNLDSASIENVGNGWYRCQIQKTGAGVEMLIFSSNIANSTPTASGTVFIWGAQLNIGSTAKPYFPTTDRLNVPRLTYQNGGGGCPSLLLEKQSTNLITYSEQFDNASWSKSNVTITANNTTSPDGTQNADLSTATAGGELLQGVVLSTSTSYTFSFYVKKGTASDAKYRVYNFDAGVNVVAPTSYISQTSTSDWVRVVVSFTTGATGTNYGIYLLDQTSAGTMYFWGAQLEASSYPTSYIPTTSASATRVADECFKTGISSLIGQTEGTLFADFTINALANFGTPLSVNDGSTANYIWLTIFANGNLRAELFNSSGVQATMTYSGAVVGGRYKMAFAYKTNDFAMYVNGSQVGIATSGTTFSGTTLSRIDNDITSPALYSLASQKINQTALFKTRLTNAELASLTTI